MITHRSTIVSGSLIVCLLAVITVFAKPIAAQCPSMSDEGTTSGITKFNTVKSQMWHNDGQWSGIFSDSSTGLYFYNLSSTTGAAKGALVDSNSKGIPDVLWDGTNLFVLVWKSVLNATLYKYSYDASTKVYTAMAGFPVELPLHGGSTSAIVLDEDSTGKLWATYTGTEGGFSDGIVHVIWSTSADHRTWDTAGVTLASGLVPNITEISAIVHFGSNKLGVAWTSRPANEIAFRYHIDGQPEMSWSAKETVDSGLGPSGLGSVANDHLSIKAAPDGRIFLVAKDHDNDGLPAHMKQGRIWLYVRSTGGVWGSKTSIQPDLSQQPTRPILSLDVTGNMAYVFYHDESPLGTKRIFMARSPMDNLVFSTPCAFSNAQLSNPTSTKQNVTASTGLMTAASTGATASNEIVFRRIELAARPGAYECDVNRSGTVTIADWVQIGRYVAGMDLPSADVFQQADSAPNMTLGDGMITIADWVQCGRYVAGLDPLTAAGGPAGSSGIPSPAVTLQKKLKRQQAN